MANKKSNYLQLAAYLFIAVILVIAIGIAKDCSRLQYSPLEGNSGGDTLDIALLYGPGSYYLYDDSLSGINHDIALEFSRQTLTPIKIWPISDPAKGLDNLESGAFDVLASIPLDNYIKNKYPVTESVFLDRMVLIQLADSITDEVSVKSSLDLRGKTVAVAPGSSGLQRIKNLSDEIGGNIEITTPADMSDELLCLQVASGSTPLAVVNERVAKAIATKYPRLKYHTNVSFTQFQVWAFNPQDSMVCNRFNEWFENFTTTPQYREILNKY